MLTAALAIALGVAVAWWTWAGRLGTSLGRWAAVARAVAVAALLLLLVDPGFAGSAQRGRPIVLLDNSVSMHAQSGRAGEAAHLAASLGDTVPFGELTRGEPGGHSDLGDALVASLAGGRPVVVVTDGEISDAAAIPAELLKQSTVHLLPRVSHPDIGIDELSAPTQLVAGDTLAFEIDATRTDDAPDSALVEVSDSTTVLLHGVLRFGRSLHTRVRLAGPLPRGLQGERWLRIERRGAADAEPGDDVRWWRISVAPTPGVVVIASRPDWDGRALYRTLVDVADAPVRGFVQLQPGSWRRMDDLRSVTLADVNTAARGASVLAVRGDVQPWRTLGRARLLWPDGVQLGDWYVSVAGASPVNGAFAGIVFDSLPAGLSIHPVDSAGGEGWVGAEARLSRRGLPVPVIAGRDDHGRREITFGIDGLSRWALRGGTAEQVWRTLLAGATSWLLAAPEGDSVLARPVVPVVQRGRPVRFRWSGAGNTRPVEVRLTSGAVRRVDTLRFDASGMGALELPVGRYRYALAGGGSGSFAVEPYSDELLPATVTLAAHEGSASRSAPRRSVRELLWLFGVAVAGFGAEWMLRRRIGVR